MLIIMVAIISLCTAQDEVAAERLEFILRIHFVPGGGITQPVE